jgi:hypothetical protein
MGRVFLGASVDGDQVAVKVIRADLAMDPEFRARFRREVTVARKVSSRFTAPDRDHDRDPDGITGGDRNPDGNCNRGRDRNCDPDRNHDPGALRRIVAAPDARFSV